MSTFIEPGGRNSPVLEHAQFLPVISGAAVVMTLNAIAPDGS